MRHINAIHRAVEDHDKKGRLHSHGKNQTTANIVHTATEFSELIDEIIEGKRDDLGYEIEVEDQS